MNEDAAIPDKPDLPVVILSTADICAPIWTNKQHIASRLVAEREVHYIESIGLRAPSLVRKDIGRLIKRAGIILFKRNTSRKKDEDRQHKPGIENLRIHTPLVVPFHAFGIVRALNRWLIRSRIMSQLPERYALWTFSPLTYGLEARAEKVVYHSVDLLHTITGVPRGTLLSAERQLIERADEVIASSKGVADHLSQQGADPLLWENVADIDLFHKSRSDIRERRAIFVGNLTPSKVDFSIFEAIVATGVRLALAGPFSIDGTRRDPSIDRLLQSPLVEYLGVLSQEELAIELGRSWVGIIPYHVNEYTAGVFPMKVYEYLSSGLPVVATPLPSLAGKSISGLTVIESSKFADEVATLGTADYSAPEDAYGDNSWEARMVQIRTLLATGEEAHKL